MARRASLSRLRSVPSPHRSSSSASLGTSTILWEGVIPTLAADYRVVAWDLPGHGASPAASAPFTVEDLADAVAAAVGEPFLYAGVSLGGAWAVPGAAHPGK